MNEDTAFVLLCLIGAGTAAVLFWRALVPDLYWSDGGAYAPSEIPPELPPAPMVLEDFGVHQNPLEREGGSCKSKFRRVDDRTWQCISCKLVRFQRPEPKAMEGVS